MSAVKQLRPTRRQTLCCGPVLNAVFSGVVWGWGRGRSPLWLCGSCRDCCLNTMPLPSYFTGSFAFLPLPLNLLIFCPVLFTPLPPLIGPRAATCHMKHRCQNCSAPRPKQLLLWFCFLLFDFESFCFLYCCFFYLFIILIF